jgi:hypothetical protein
VRPSRNDHGHDADVESLRSVSPALHEHDVEEDHERERNWNSHRPQWHTHPQSNGHGHTSHRHEDHGHHAEHEEHPGRPMPSTPATNHTRFPAESSRLDFRSNQSLLKTPKVPGAWGTPGGRLSPATPATHQQDTSKYPATPYPPGGWTSTPGSMGRKGILKVRFDPLRQQTLTQELAVDEANEAPSEQEVISEVPPPHPPVSSIPQEKVDREDSGSDTDVPPVRPPVSRSKIRLVDETGMEVQMPVESVESVGTGSSATPVGSGPHLGPNTLVNRLRDKLADIRSEFPPTPNQSVSMRSLVTLY